MKDVLRIKQQIPASKEEVFRFFTDPKLIEKWASPRGMTLRVPEMDAKTGGRYRFEHSSAQGVYVCTGHFKEFIPGQKLVHVDHVLNPGGKEIYDNLESTVIFMEDPGGTIIYVNITGFKDQDSMDECEQGWKESFENLLEQFLFREENLNFRTNDRIGHSGDLNSGIQ